MRGLTATAAVHRAYILPTDADAAVDVDEHDLGHASDPKQGLKPAGHDSNGTSTIETKEKKKEARPAADQVDCRCWLGWAELG